MPDRVLPYYEADQWMPHEDEPSCIREAREGEYFANGETENTTGEAPELTWIPENRNYE